MRNDEPLTHRVQAAVTNGASVTITTRGDANPSDETFTLPTDAIVGRVVAHVPRVGSIVAWAGTSTSRRAAGIGVGAYVAISLLVSARRRSRSTRQGERARTLRAPPHNECCQRAPYQAICATSLQRLATADPYRVANDQTQRRSRNAGRPWQFGGIEDGFMVEFSLRCGTYYMVAYGVSADAFKEVIMGLVMTD